MIGGFALVAAPAEYGQTGVKTFMVSHTGVVYQKDLGPRRSQNSRRWSASTPTSPGRPSCNSGALRARGGPGADFRAADLDLKVTLTERSGEVVAELARRPKSTLTHAASPSSPTAIRKSLGSEGLKSRRAPTAPLQAVLVAMTSNYVLNNNATAHRSSGSNIASASHHEADAVFAPRSRAHRPRGDKKMLVRSRPRGSAAGA